jgi:hypothetical protein
MLKVNSRSTTLGMDCHSLGQAVQEPEYPRIRYANWDTWVKLITCPANLLRYQILANITQVLAESHVLLILSPYWQLGWWSGYKLDLSP